MAARTLRKKKCFFGIIFMFTLTWITEEELERVIENNETNFVGKKTWKFKAAVRK